MVITVSEVKQVAWTLVYVEYVMHWYVVLCE